VVGRVVDLRCSARVSPRNESRSPLAASPTRTRPRTRTPPGRNAGGVRGISYRLSKYGPFEWFDNYFEQDRIFILTGVKVDVCRFAVIGRVANIGFENSTDADCNEPVLGLKLVKN
jgi:hypothetical protein